MGVGFVLFVWALLLCGIGSFVAVGVFIWMRGTRDADLTRAVKASALPFVLLLWGAFAFSGYIYWCIAVRHVDIGTGDLAYVPITRDYSLCVDDLSPGGRIEKMDCDNEVTVDDVAELALVGDSVIGKKIHGTGFVLNVRSGDVREFATVDEAFRGFPQRPALQDAYAFYLQQRWGWPDVIFVFGVGIPAVILFFVWGRRYLWAPSAV